MKQFHASCPVEWHLEFMPSKVWSARVSVAYYYINDHNTPPIQHPVQHPSLDILCSNPTDLYTLMSRALILVSGQVDGFSSMTQDLKNTSERFNKRRSGVINVYLQIPVYGGERESSQLTLVDLPSLNGLIPSPHFTKYVKDLIKFYVLKECIITVVEQGSGECLYFGAINLF